MSKYVDMFFISLLGLIVAFVSIVSLVSGKTVESGPSTTDIVTIMFHSGIRNGSSFEVGGHTYTLSKLTVAKTGPESFVVQFVTK